MHKQILQTWKTIGMMEYFWGDYFDVRFYVAGLLSKKHKKILLDIGCGSGILLHNASASLKIGVDFSLKFLKKARELDQNLQLICCDVKHLPLRNDFFPNVLATHIISSFSTQAERIQVSNEIQRVSSNDCEIIITGATRLSKHFDGDYSSEKRKNYLRYLDLEEYFKGFEINAFGYGDYSRKTFFLIKKLFYSLPDKFVEIFGVENIIFKKLISEKSIESGRSYILICKRGSKTSNESKP